MSADLRKDNIYKVLNKYYKDIDHAKQVKKLSIRLFECTKGLVHNLDDEYKILIEAGALLHDIGYFLSSEDHHKNAYKLIVQDGIEGFDSREVLIIGNIARYHRSVCPRKAHSNYQALESKKQKTLAVKLASFVRIADGLDRLHMSAVKDLSAKYNKKHNVLTIYVEAKDTDFEPDLIATIRKKDLLERAFETQVVFKLKS